MFRGGQIVCVCVCACACACACMYVYVWVGMCNNISRHPIVLRSGIKRKVRIRQSGETSHPPVGKDVGGKYAKKTRLFQSFDFIDISRFAYFICCNYIGVEMIRQVIICL